MKDINALNRGAQARELRRQAQDTIQAYSGAPLNRELRRSVRRAERRQRQRSRKRRGRA